MTQPSYQFADLHLDMTCGRLRRGEQDIPLPKLSYQLLCVLVERAPALLDQQQLIDATWGNIVVGDETLKQRVRLLRKALGDDARNPRYIEAVRGRGYRLLPKVQTLAPAPPAPMISGHDRVPPGLAGTLGRPWTLASRIFAAVFVILLLFTQLLQYGWESDNALDPSRLAVLPFETAPTSAPVSLLAAGLNEQLISRLSQLNLHQIIASASIRALAGDFTESLAMARQLNSGLVMVGALHQGPQGLTVRVQLEDVNRQTVLWSQYFSGQADNPLPLQQAIVEAAVGAVAALEDSDTRVAAPTPPTANRLAYEYFLKGRDYYHRYRLLDNDLAITMYRQALRQDPGFALAHAGLAEAYSQGVFQFDGPPELLGQSLEHAFSAIAMAPDEAAGYKALGLAYYVNGWLHKAIHANRQALDHNPQYAEAVTNLGFIHRARGNLVEALKWHRRAWRQSPHHSAVAMHLAQTLATLGEHQLAADWYRHAHQLQPDYALADYYHGRLMLSQGQSAEAVTQLQQRLARRPDNLLRKGLAEARLFQGDTAASLADYKQLAAASRGESQTFARLMIALLEQSPAASLQPFILHYQDHLARGSEHPQPSLALGLIHARLEQPGQALRYLTQAVQQGYLDGGLLQRHPLLASLQTHPGFVRLLEQIRTRIQGQQQQAEAQGLTRFAHEALRQSRPL